MLPLRATASALHLHPASAEPGSSHDELYEGLAALDDAVDVERILL